MRKLKNGFWQLSIHVTFVALVGAGSFLLGGCVGGSQRIHSSHGSENDRTALPQNHGGSQKSADKSIINNSDDPYFESLSCTPPAHQLAKMVHEIASYLEQQKLYYNKQPMTDCSGIMHRVFLQMRQQCATLPFPSYQYQRSSRDIAHWFYNKGGLIIVENPLEMDRFIRPGAIMFYGYTANTGNKVNSKALFGRRGISHVGIVVDVNKNARGQVIGYSLFHGRSKGKTAKITRYHLRKPGRQSLPPYGNYNQHWLAAAFVIVDDPHYAEQ